MKPLYGYTEKATDKLIHNFHWESSHIFEHKQIWQELQDKPDQQKKINCCRPTEALSWAEDTPILASELHGFDQFCEWKIKIIYILNDFVFASTQLIVLIADKDN